MDPSDVSEGPSRVERSTTLRQGFRGRIDLFFVSCRPSRGEGCSLATGVTRSVVQRYGDLRCSVGRGRRSWRRGRTGSRPGERRRSGSFVLENLLWKGHVDGRVGSEGQITPSPTRSPRPGWVKGGRTICKKDVGSCQRGSSKSGRRSASP